MSKPWIEPRVRGKEGLVKVAALQMEPHVGEKDENLKKSIELIEKAASQGVKLMVLPELCNTGYVFNSKDEAAAAAEKVPGGPSYSLWEEEARKRGVYICAGVTEKDGDSLYDTAVLIGPRGYIGKYRKVHLWDEEKLFFEPGNSLPIYNLPFGRVGMMICYDGWMPEVARILAIKGVDIICDPSAWVVVPSISTLDHPLAPEIHMAQANMNHIYMVCSVRVGIERGVSFLGSSCIVGPSGFLAGPASPHEEQIISAELNAVQVRYKNWTKMVNPISDRRIDVYDKMLGYKE